MRASPFLGSRTTIVTFPKASVVLGLKCIEARSPPSIGVTCVPLSVNPDDLGSGASPVGVITSCGGGEPAGAAATVIEAVSDTPVDAVAADSGGVVDSAVTKGAAVSTYAF
jgi:hypothetical protein